MIAKLAGTAPNPVAAILDRLEHDLDCLLADLAQDTRAIDGALLIDKILQEEAQCVGHAFSSRAKRTETPLLAGTVHLRPSADVIRHISPIA